MTHLNISAAAGPMLHYSRHCYQDLLRHYELSYAPDTHRNFRIRFQNLQIVVHSEMPFSRQASYFIILDIS